MTHPTTREQPMTDNQSTRELEEKVAEAKRRDTQSKEEQIVARMEAIVSLLSPGMDETDRECAYIEMEDLVKCVRLALASSEGRITELETQVIRIVGERETAFVEADTLRSQLSSAEQTIAGHKETYARELKEAFEAGFVCGHSRQNSKSGFDEFLTQKETK